MVNTMVSKDDFAVLNSDGEYEEIAKTGEKREKVVQKNLGEELSTEGKKWLARYLDQLVSSAKAAGRQEAEMRGQSKMRQMMIIVAASALLSFGSLALQAAKIYGMV